MQVPAGQPLAGMAHHKIHDANWTGLPLLPHLDPQQRELHPVSTAATLNLAATAAQAARLYAPYDRDVRGARLAAARTAWPAALANPDRLRAGVRRHRRRRLQRQRRRPTSSTGRPPSCTSTTGEKEYRRLRARLARSTPPTSSPARGFDWAVDGRGRPPRPGHGAEPRCPAAPRCARSVVDGADKYLAIQDGAPVRPAVRPGRQHLRLGLEQPGAQQPGRAWRRRTTSPAGPKYRDGVLEGMDYLFGRNALNQSVRDRLRRGQLAQPAQPLVRPPARPGPAEPAARARSPAARTRCIQDPYAQSKLTGCVGQFCYIDDIQSWSTNELTINWNSPLAWVASFVADQDNGLV